MAGAGYDHCGVLADLRDDHRDATQELARLFDLHDLYFGPPGTVLPLEGPLADEVRRHLMVLGRSQPDLRDALEDWAGEASSGLAICDVISNSRCTLQRSVGCRIHLQVVLQPLVNDHRLR